MKLTKPTWPLAVATLATVLSTACSAQGNHPPITQTPPDSQTARAKPAPGSGLFIGSENLRPLYFASGASQLTPGAMDMLKENVDWLKRNMPLHIMVAGYSDGQGTPEQNLAMGQRRAGALRDFYVSMGIPRSRISTISYGQEEPACFEATDECQSQNRRADTLIENKELVSR